jgi:hypothetical protein
VYASCGFHRRIAARFFAANNFVACTEIDAKNFNFRAADPWRAQRSPAPASKQDSSRKKRKMRRRYLRCPKPVNR